MRAYDSRLLGTWRSDRRRTAEEIEARSDIPKTKKAALSAMFGHLTVLYTRTRCYSTSRARPRAFLSRRRDQLGWCRGREPIGAGGDGRVNLPHTV